MIEIEAKALAGAMKAAAGVVEARNTIPILANVRLAARGDTLDLLATDLDIELRQQVPLAQPGELSTTVDTHRLAAIAAAAEPGARIALDLDGARLTLRSGRSRWTLPTLPFEDFPELPWSGEGSHRATMDGKALASAIERTAWSMSDEELRYYLCGIFLNAEMGRMRLTATNGHTLACVDTLVEWPEGAPEIILPRRLTAALARLAGEHREIALEWDQHKLRAVAGAVTLTGKSIDGIFPDYRWVIPPAADDPVMVSPVALRAALRRAALVCSGKTRAVKVKTGADQLAISASDPDAGSGCEEVPASCRPGHQSGFNASYLAGALSAIGGDSVELHQADAGSPALLRAAAIRAGDSETALTLLRRIAGAFTANAEEQVEQGWFGSRSL